MPIKANNFYRGHSQISKKILRRKHKGPLYNEAGRLCIDLTQKYIYLEDFRMLTKLSDLKHCLVIIQNEKIQHRRKVEDRMTQRQRSQQKVHPVHNSIQAIRYGTNDQSPKPQH